MFKVSILTCGLPMYHFFNVSISKMLNKPPPPKKILTKIPVFGWSSTIPTKMCCDMLAPLASAKCFVILCPCLHKHAKTGQNSSKMRFCWKHFWLILGNTGQLMARFGQKIQISRWYMTLKSPFSYVWALVEPPIHDLWSKSFKIHLAKGVRDGLSHFLKKKSGFLLNPIWLPSVHCTVLNTTGWDISLIWTTKNSIWTGMLARWTLLYCTVLYCTNFHTTVLYCTVLPACYRVG